ncbi:MAG TPA: polyprenyl synthetase family protein, partial [Rugosimonospora sp.]|nr:polyprenyl synthetase family protein [Rugosimonospora sp.]
MRETAAPVTAADHAGVRGRIDRVLRGFLADRRRSLLDIDPELGLVCDTVDAFVLRGGKRLRPLFGYWAYRGAGGVDDDAVVAALASLELVQASALIHDDVMDDSDTRRGEPATHRRFAMVHGDSGWAGDPDGFGASSAILLGDLCMVWSDELLQGSGLDLDNIARARGVFDTMRTELIVGQYLDVLTQVTGETSVQRAAKVARYKSAKYTVERPMLFGAALAGADSAVRRAYSGYGLPLGEAFQLRDVILGVYGDPARTGKPAGDDLREGKRTYLVASAFEAAGPADRAVLAAGLGDPALDRAGVDRLRE